MSTNIRLHWYQAVLNVIFPDIKLNFRNCNCCVSLLWFCNDFIFGRL